MFAKMHCQLRRGGAATAAEPGARAVPALVKICVKCKQADAASRAMGYSAWMCVCVCVCVTACVCCGINPFTGVWPESTGVNVDAGAASRKTFVTFALRAACTGWQRCSTWGNTPLSLSARHTRSWPVQFICTLHLPINSYLSSHAGLLPGDCINQCGPSDNSCTTRVQLWVCASSSECGIVVWSWVQAWLNLFRLCSAMGWDEPEERQVRSSLNFMLPNVHTHAQPTRHAPAAVSSLRHSHIAVAVRLHWAFRCPRTSSSFQSNCIPF